MIVFGSGQLFRKTQEFVLYFGGSVNGLRIGAPVKFKGVDIGIREGCQVGNGTRRQSTSDPSHH